MLNPNRLLKYPVYNPREQTQQQKITQIEQSQLQSYLPQSQFLQQKSYSKSLEREMKKSRSKDRRPTQAEIAQKTKRILQIIDKGYQELRKTAQIGSLNFISRIADNLSQQKVQTVLRNLARGYLITKHSKHTKQPHKKYLYISLDHRYLCWKSLDKSDQKIIELKKIQFLACNDLVESWRSSTTLDNSENNCFIVVSQTRILEIQCRNEEEMERIVGEVEEAIKNSKRMNLAYQYS